MLFLLPPSETKRPGGDPDRPLELAALSRAELTASRRHAMARLRELSSNLTTAADALGLGPRNRDEAAVNRAVRNGPTLPALERFDGVLYEALGADSLPPGARDWVRDHVAIASALFGLLCPEDRIPAYRLSADTRLPGTTLRSIWRAPLTAVLEAERAPVIDLRSEAYAALGPAPEGSVFVRVVSETNGRRRALNHFNKAAKGALIRSLAIAGRRPASIAELLDVAAAAGHRLEHGAHGELDLVVD